MKDFLFDVKLVLRVLLFFLLLAVVWPTYFHLEPDMDPWEDRWQFEVRGLAWTFLIDNWETHGDGYYFAVPEFPCQDRSGGGKTGYALFQYYVGYSIRLSIHGGDWWGNPGDYHLGHWCSAAVHNFTFWRSAEVKANLDARD